MFPDWFLNLPWNIFDTMIGLAELLVIVLPATVAFMYYRIRTVSVWILDIADNGTTLLLHNKTNRSIFITDITVVPLKNCNLKNPVVAWEKMVSQLKPDDYMEIVINYTKPTQHMQSFRVVVKYNHRNKKRIKVTV